MFKPCSQPNNVFGLRNISPYIYGPLGVREVLNRPYIYIYTALQALNKGLSIVCSLYIDYINTYIDKFK